MGSQEAAIALPQTKTADRGARLQAVTIEDITVSDLLSRVFGNDPPHRGLIAGGTKRLQLFFNQVRDAVGLHDSPWTLATLRGGGAVAYLRQTGGNIVWLQFRGRWESFRSMRHYVQSGLFMQAYATLPAVTKDRVTHLAALAPLLMGPSAAESVLMSRCLSQRRLPKLISFGRLRPPRSLRKWEEVGTRAPFRKQYNAKGRIVDT
eukprot:2917846-Amphidinium_carterae.1